MSGDLTYLFDEEAGDITTMDAVKRVELLNGVEELGMIQPAAAEVGLTMEMVADAIAQDPRLQTDISLAQGRYKAGVLRRLRHLAEEGSLKAIVGGKNKDEILGNDVIPNDKAMDILSRMQFADELAIVTRQRIKAELASGTTDELKVDLSRLDREDRKAMDTLFRKARDAIKQEEK